MKSCITLLHVIVYAILAGSFEEVEIMLPPNKKIFMRSLLLCEKAGPIGIQKRKFVVITRILVGTDLKKLEFLGPSDPYMNMRRTYAQKQKEAAQRLRIRGNKNVAKPLKMGLIAGKCYIGFR